MFMWTFGACWVSSTTSNSFFIRNFKAQESLKEHGKKTLKVNKQRGSSKNPEKNKTNSKTEFELKLQINFINL